MAFSNPKVYLSGLARPLYDRFANEPSSYELAISCCIIIYHFADVLGYVREIKAHDASSIISEQIPKFEIIRALANAGKHVELTRHTKQELIGLRAEHLEREEASAVSDGSYFLGGTTLSDMPETVVVTLPDGTKIDVLQICGIVLESLEKHPDFFQV